MWRARDSGELGAEGCKFLIPVTSRDWDQQATNYDPRRLLAISSVHFDPAQKTRSTHVAGMEDHHVCGENLEMVGWLGEVGERRPWSDSAQSPITDLWPSFIGTELAFLSCDNDIPA